MEINKQIEILNNICPEEIPYRTSKRMVRSKFFSDIKTEIQAYLLGFYLADGSLNDKRNTLRVKVTKMDKEIPELFAKYISPKARFIINPSFKMIGPSGREIIVKESAQVDIASKQIKEDLTKFGYGERKTYNDNHLPRLTDELMWHFIRGYFDGDGCITGSVRLPNKKNREVNVRFTIHAEWVSKTDSLLQELQLFLDKFGIVSHIYIDKSNNIYRLIIHKRNSIDLLFKYLYNDFNFCLLRKYKKYEHYVNTEVTQLITEYRNAQKVNVNESNNPSTSVGHPTGMKMCAELTGNCESYEIKSS